MQKEQNRPQEPTNNGMTRSTVEKSQNREVPKDLQPPPVHPKVYPGQTKATFGQPPSGSTTQSGGNQGSSQKGND